MGDMVTLNGWFKTSYAKDIEGGRLIPDIVMYGREIPTETAEANTGGDYNYPLVLSSEQGITKAGPNAGAFALNTPVSMNVRQTTLAGSQLVLRSGFDYESITRMKSSNSFEKETKPIVGNMMDSAYQYLEYDLMWGHSALGIGTVLNAAAAPLYTITIAEFAPGLWWASEGRELHIYSPAGVYRGHSPIATYSIDAPRSVTTVAVIPGVANGDIMYFSAGGAASEMHGIYNFMTVAGNFLGVNGTTWQLWSPCTAYAVGGALSFQHIQAAITRAYKRGLGKKSKGVQVVVNPYGWLTLANDEAALRTYDASYSPSKFENGAENIKFYSVAGPVEIIAHDCMKEGYAFIHPSSKKCMKRIGSKPSPTFNLPGQEGEKYFDPMSNNAGVELRNYWNCALFSPLRSQFQLMSGIVNPLV